MPGKGAGFDTGKQTHALKRGRTRTRAFDGVQALEAAQRTAEQQRTAAWSYQQQGKEREAELQRRVASLEEEKAGLRRKWVPLGARTFACALMGMHTSHS